MNSPYTSNFFKGQKNGSVQSAQEIVPIIVDLLNPKNIVDVGCGVGTWLKIFKENGVTDMLGVDGEYVDKEQLMIPRDKFISHDLEQPFHHLQKFDLAISLEVGEHLPSHSADQLVQTLTSLAPIVVFSAAIPFQGGTHHVNEQWQSYWAQIFKRYNFCASNGLRNKIWTNNKILSWYKQNIVLYINESKLNNLSIYLKEHVVHELGNLDIVHPESYYQAVDPKNMLQQQLLRSVKAFPYILKRVLVKK